MKRWHKLLWAVAAVVIASAALLFRQPQEPRYAGRSLRHWVLLCDHGNVVEIREAAQAISAIGTNALPFLLEWIPGTQPAWKQKLLQASYNHEFFPRPLASYLHRDIFLSQGALSSFKVLGPVAKPAVPVLKQRLQDPRPEVWSSAMLALGYLGGEGLPLLIEALTNQANPRDVRFWALTGIGCADTNGAPALPALLQCIEDKDRRIASAALMQLGGLGREPELVLPVLTNGLQSSDFDWRWCSITSLGRFGPQAASAVPLLLQVLEEPTLPRGEPGRQAAELRQRQFELREAVTNALHSIAPGVL